jgi:hypothetical protein
MKRLMSVIAVLGLLGGAAIAMTGIASAGSRGHVNKCSNVNSGLSLNQVACSGTINGNTLKVEVKNVKVLSDNELNVLNLELNNVLNNAVTVKHIQLKAVEVFVTKFHAPVTLCQVKVVEIGQTTTNIAKC